MKLFLKPKGSQYLITDEKDVQIYTIKKKGFSGQLKLLDKNNYQLFLLQPDLEGKKPVFNLFNGDELYGEINCTSEFIEPSFEYIGKSGPFTMKSKDRIHFTVLKEDKNIGTIQSVNMTNGDTSYEMNIEMEFYEEFVPFFPICIDITFYRKK